MSNVHVELRDDRCDGARNIFLVLGADAVFDDGTPALGALRWQGGFECARDACGLGAVDREMALLAPWGLRFSFGRTFGKGCGLPLAAPLVIIELLFQLGDARFEACNVRRLFGNKGVCRFELLHEFVVGHHALTIHDLSSNFNPTFWRLTQE